MKSERKISNLKRHIQTQEILFTFKQQTKIIFLTYQMPKACSRSP